MSDIGAIESGRWHASHFDWKIRATSLVNVGARGASAAAADAAHSTADATDAALKRRPAITRSFQHEPGHERQETVTLRRPGVKGRTRGDWGLPAEAPRRFERG